MNKDARFPGDLPRREFLKLCVTATTMMGLPFRMHSQVAAPGQPGTCIRYCKDDFLLKRIPLKLSPHQVGIQEMLLVSSLRGRCP